MTLDRKFSGHLAETPLGRVHVPPKRKIYRNYRECLRRDFGYRCVYCGAHEVEVSAGMPYGAFEIDHFRPKSKRQFAGLAATYTNLVWSCRLCNSAKGSEWPLLKDEKRGRRFLNPVTDDVQQHLTASDNQILPKTDNGEYHLDVLDLNSPTHIARRVRRRKKADFLSLLRQLISHQENGITEVQRQSLQAEVDSLVAELEGPPQEPALRCACDSRLHPV